MEKVNQFMSLPCSESSSTFLPIIIKLKSQLLSTAWQASGMQACPDHPPPRVSMSPGAPRTPATLASGRGLDICCLLCKEHSASLFPKVHPTTTTIRCLLTHSLPKHVLAATPCPPYLSPLVTTWHYTPHLLFLCVSLSCPQTWTVQFTVMPGCLAQGSHSTHP